MKKLELIRWFRKSSLKADQIEVNKSLFIRTKEDVIQVIAGKRQHSLPILYTAKKSRISPFGSDEEKNRGK